MFHQNVPSWERTARGIAALVLIVGGIVWAFSDLVWGGITIASGAGLLVTALSGWCPLCAAVGRTLPEVDKKVTVARL